MLLASLTFVQNCVRQPSSSCVTLEDLAGRDHHRVEVDELGARDRLVERHLHLQGHALVAVGLGADLRTADVCSLGPAIFVALVQWKWIRALLAVSKTGSVMKPGTPNA